MWKYLLIDYPHLGASGDPFYLFSGHCFPARRRQIGLGKRPGLRHIKAMTKVGPKKTSPPRSRFAEHRAPPLSISPTAKPAEITAVSKSDATPAATGKKQPKEIGGPKGLEPTRYGDWERDGRCVDF